MIDGVQEVGVAIGILVAEQLVDGPVAVRELCRLLVLERLLVRTRRSAAAGGLVLLLLLHILLATGCGDSRALRAVAGG